MPPQDVIEGLLEDVYSYGMSAPGIVPADFAYERPAILEFVRRAAQLGCAMGKVQLAQRTEAGDLLPQKKILHFADITAQVPWFSIVNEWKLQIDNNLFDLCLVGATRPRFTAEQLKLHTSMIAVWQICEHGDQCSMRQRGDIRDIGRYDISKGGGKRALLDYCLLAFTKPDQPSTGVLTLLGTKHCQGATATLVVNPNHFEREFALGISPAEQPRPHDPHGSLRRIK